MPDPTVRWRAGGRTLTAAAGTQVGNRYPENFDVLHLDRDRPVGVVADGMGAGEGSRRAGRTAVATFAAGVWAAPPSPGHLRAVVAGVQARVRAAAAGLAELTGCTLTAFVGDDSDGSAWLVQIGDSRVYRMRAGLLEILTTDHTAAWVGSIYGWFHADSPEGRAARYRLSRFIGHPESPEPDVLNVSLLPDDVYCVCTDGVAEQVSYEGLRDVLRDVTDPAAAVAALLTRTLAAGGEDNATVIVVRVS